MKPIDWMDRLVGDTRGRLIGLMRRSRRTIGELSQTLGLTDNAVRTHVAGLERDGIVEPAGSNPAERGKPARLYALTAEGEELFPKAYALILGGLVDEIDRTQGRDKAVRLLQSVGRGAVAGMKPAADLGGRVNAAAGVLRELGGDVDVSRTAAGWRIQGYGCPLSAVTAEHPQVCELARALVEEVTGEPVTECCEHGARPRCAFELPSKKSGH
ncbi:MAG TPA: hypothetical protein VGI92_10055 [Gemmatimonadales bacterium]|jgi:predicted ArsR family transcriptional regulator